MSQTDTQLYILMHHKAQQHFCLLLHLVTAIYICKIKSLFKVNKYMLVNVKFSTNLQNEWVEALLWERVESVLWTKRWTVWFLCSILVPVCNTEKHNNKHNKDDQLCLSARKSPVSYNINKNFWPEEKRTMVLTHKWSFLDKHLIKDD